MIATCPAPEALRRYVNGDVSELESDELTAHVTTCDSCQRSLERADLDDTLVGELKHSVTVEESLDFELEPECRSAMAKALGALAEVGQSSTADDIALPEAIGEYRIVRPIGRGGMGSVYLAQHTKLDRTVAVKVLASNRLADARMHDRFEKEMLAVGSLSHPNIVTAYDARDVDGIALLVTEWVDGLDLKEIVRRSGPMSIADVAEVGLRVAEALSYIDSQGLVHRDLKPSNVMINRDGEVKVLDLGLARLRGRDNEADATATGQAMGTADYVAPEQIKDAREVDIRADVYSLGCTLYHLLSGRAPFEDESYANAFAKLTAHVSTPPPPIQSLVPGLPKPFAQVVMQSLAKSPEERPRSPEEVARILRQFNANADLESQLQRAIASDGDGSSTSFVTPPTATQTGFWKRRVSLLTAIGCGLLGAIVGLVLGVLITIEHADGTRTQIDVPPGSVAEIDPTGDIHVKLPSDGAAANPSSPLTGAQASRGQAQSVDDPNAESPLDDLLPLALTPPDDMPRLSGVWSVESAMHYGGQAPLPPADNLTLVIHDGDYVWLQRSLPFAIGELDLDSDRQRIIFDAKGGETGSNKAIYRFDDRGLQICIASKENPDFPMAFQPVRTPNLTVLRLTSVRLPEDPIELRDYMQSPKNANLMYAFAMLQKLRMGVPIEALAQASEDAKEAAMTAQSMNHLKQMALAFHNFHAAYRCFPSSQRGVPGAPDSKNPPCSWRVAILPFIEQQALFEQYRLDEPWDSENNLKLLDQMPDLFRRPGAPSDSTTTNYVGFSGEDTALGESENVRIRDIIDGTSNTVLLIEADTDIPWTKPEDFPIEDVSELGLLEEQPILACFADGSVQRIEVESEADLKKLANVKDGSL